VFLLPGEPLSCTRRLRWFTSNISVSQDVPDKATQFFQHALRVAPDHTKSRLAMKVGTHHFTASWHCIPIYHPFLLSLFSLFLPSPSSPSLFPSSPFLLLLPFPPPPLLSSSSSPFLLLLLSFLPLPASFLFQKSKSLQAKKDEGNRAFRSGNNHRAYDIYSEALKIDPLNTFTNAKLYCNRALVGSKVS